MSYLALARKYRPDTFGGIAGQDHITRTLARAIARGRIHHAYLFCGARGVGKTTAARAMARALNCAEGPTVDPCGVCVSCKAVLAGNSPDLIEIDGASNNGVENVRELRETVRYPPQGRYKVYLIDEVHMLSTSAFNALLKTLEEPPPHVVFVFATTEPHKIPDTILSRVLRFDFRRIGVDVVAARLREIVAREGAEATDDALRLLARAGEGSMRDAQSLLDKVLATADGPIDAAIVAETLGMVDRDVVLRGLEALVTGDLPTLFALIAEVHELGVDLSHLSADLLDAVRDATFLALGPEAGRHVDLPAAELDRVRQLVESVDPADTDRLPRLFHALLDVQDRVARSDRPRLVLEMALARIATVRPLVPVDAMLARVEELEARLRTGARRAAGSPGLRDRGPQGGPRASRTPQRARSTRSRATHGGRRVPDDASDDERWGAFRRALAAMSPPADHLLHGFARRALDTLVLSVPAGREAAEAEAAARRDDVQLALAACYGPDVRLVVETTLASVRPEVDPSLEAEVLRDPAVKRLMAVFGATLGALHPDDDAPPRAR